MGWDQMTTKVVKYVGTNSNGTYGSQGHAHLPSARAYTGRNSTLPP